MCVWTCFHIISANVDVIFCVMALRLVVCGFFCGCFLFSFSHSLRVCCIWCCCCRAASNWRNYRLKVADGYVQCKTNFPSFRTIFSCTTKFANISTSFISRITRNKKLSWSHFAIYTIRHVLAPCAATSLCTTENWHKFECMPEGRATNDQQKKKKRHTNQAFRPFSGNRVERSLRADAHQCTSFYMILCT